MVGNSISVGQHSILYGSRGEPLVGGGGYSGMEEWEEEKAKGCYF